LIFFENQILGTFQPIPSAFILQNKPSFSLMPSGISCIHPSRLL